ncbi:hypothetical protein C8J57DRAFT_1518189 [Mycena rebaudengoi]|nr:hypothetical protein C8J57DRAFT_1518189 [Mycena rebaudengoi]
MLSLASKFPRILSLIAVVDIGISVVSTVRLLTGLLACSCHSLLGLHPQPSPARPSLKGDVMDRGDDAPDVFKEYSFVARGAVQQVGNLFFQPSVWAYFQFRGPPGAPMVQR